MEPRCRRHHARKHRQQAPLTALKRPPTRSPILSLFSWRKGGFALSPMLPRKTAFHRIEIVTFDAALRVFFAFMLLFLAVLRSEQCARKSPILLPLLYLFSRRPPRLLRRRSPSFLLRPHRLSRSARPQFLSPARGNFPPVTRPGKAMHPCGRNQRSTTRNGPHRISHRKAIRSISLSMRRTMLPGWTANGFRTCPALPGIACAFVSPTRN